MFAELSRAFSVNQRIGKELFLRDPQLVTQRVAYSGGSLAVDVCLRFIEPIENLSEIFECSQVVAVETKIGTAPVVQCMVEPVRVGGLSSRPSELV